MTQRWILAIDLGSGGPKVAVVAPDGALRATAERAVALRLGTDGSATQDARDWWSALVDGARAAIGAAGADPGGLAAVGITGQWGSTVPVDADGDPVSEVLMWADTRAEPLMRHIVGGPVTVGGLSPVKALPFLRVTGGAPNPSGADPTGHQALLRTVYADAYPRIAHLLEPVDYLGLRLTGRVAATPASMTLSWLTDNRPGAPFGYHAGMVRRARRDPALLPELLPTGSVLGPLLPGVAGQLGVAPGAPVVCGISDLHAGVVGSGALEPFATHLAVSTTQWFGTRVPFKRTDAFHQIATVPGLDGSLPVVANNQETGGAALAWLRARVFADELSFEELVALADGAPVGSGGAVFMPWLAGERSPVEDRRLRGGWLGVSLQTDRAALVRSVLEGVALNSRWLFDAYQKFLRRTVPALRMLGGGAQSAVWCQIYADVLGVPVAQVADPRFAQLRGVALWARMCLGEIGLDEAAAAVPVARTFVPDPSAQAVYGRIFAAYRRLYGSLKGTYGRLAAPPV